MIEILQSVINTSSSASSIWSLSRSSLWPMRKTDSSRSQCDHFENLPQYTLNQVAEHWQTNDCWIVVEDRVYDVTKFLDEHPGGQYIVMEHAGRDATLVFRGSCHSQDAYDMLKKYLIGVLVESERIYWSRNESDGNSTENLYSSSPQPSKSL